MASVWKDIAILTIRETPSKTKAGSGFGMWVIQKLRDGKHYDTTLRAGNFYTNAVTGDKEYPKGGLTDWDFEALKKPTPTGQRVPDGKGGTRAEMFWDVVIPLLDRKNPPPVPEPEPDTPAEQQQPAPASSEPELPPWIK